MRWVGGLWHGFGNDVVPEWITQCYISIILSNKLYYYLKQNAAAVMVAAFSFIMSGNQNR